MTMKKLGLIHTSATLVPIFHELCKELLPHVQVFNIADDSLIQDVIHYGALLPSISMRLCQHVHSAELAGADAIMVTCSSVGAAVEASSVFARVPVFRVDYAMADRAVSLGSRLGVIATLPTTLNPTVDLIQRRAQAVGKSVQVTSSLCSGAFEALMKGDVASHDRQICEKLGELIPTVDVVVLAQASMARVVQSLPSDLVAIPILSSPRLGVESLAKLFCQS